MSNNAIKQLSYIAIKLDDYTWKQFSEWKEVCDFSEGKLPTLVFVEGAGMIAIDTEDELVFQRVHGPVIDIEDDEVDDIDPMESLQDTGFWQISNGKKGLN